jgi:hypothetical protein
MEFSPSVLLLVLYPVVGFVAPLVFFSLWPKNLVFWLTYPLSYGVATSGIFLYRRLFTRLFPPRLQLGTPNFITLNLDRRNESTANNGEDNVNNR